MDETPENDQVDRPNAPARERPPVDKRMIAFAAAVIALTVGSLTPWVTFFGIGISGVSIHSDYNSGR